MRHLLVQRVSSCWLAAVFTGSAGGDARSLEGDTRSVNGDADLDRVLDLFLAAASMTRCMSRWWQRKIIATFNLTLTYGTFLAEFGR